jgi:translation initiation factor IF-3
LLKGNDRAFADHDLRVIGAEGDQLGVIKFERAIVLAKEAGLDLVLVAETSEPPVCRIMDFGKLCYEQKKKVKDQKKHQQAQKVKEIKFRINIDDHDYEYKIGHATEFLEKGCKLKVTLMFKGRELAHTEMGFKLVERIIESLREIGVPDGSPKLLGKNINVAFNPKPRH